MNLRQPKVKDVRSLRKDVDENLCKISLNTLRVRQPKVKDVRSLRKDVDENLCEISLNTLRARHPKVKDVRSLRKDVDENLCEISLNTLRARHPKVKDVRSLRKDVDENLCEISLNTLRARHPKVFIKTFGCQMNEYDSEVIRSNLSQRGYLFTEQPKEADIILLNGCSVREHAEQRLWGNLENLKRLKKIKPELIFGVLGCIAQNHKESILKRFSFVNLVCGPRNLPEIFNHIDKLNSRTQILATDKEERNFGDFNLTSTSGVEVRLKNKGYVLIMSGCNNFCSYCIVPYLRGREKSRESRDILKEVKMLVKNGCSEITLLGQNVNSYRLQATGCKLQVKNNESDFVKLLREVNKIEGIEKISFITSHPKDASEELFEAMRDLSKVEKYLHLPFQSGSNRILKLMRRGYTREDYLRLIVKLRKILPQCKLSTDVIVGFPGESEDDFQQTKELMQEVRFDNAYIFKYSSRPGTAAASFKDDVSIDVKKERNQILLELQRKIK